MENLSVSQVGKIVLIDLVAHLQDIMSVSSHGKGHIVEFSSLPALIEIADPLVDSQVVKSDIRDDLLLNIIRVGGIGDSILSGQRNKVLIVI